MEKVKIEDLEKRSQKCSCNSEQPAWGYHSYTLNKDFETLSELREAEDKAKEEQAAKEAKTAEKRADAKKVEDAYKSLANARVAAAKSIKEAEDKYYAARDAFVKKYGSYHMTYSSEDGNYTLGISDMVDILFGDIFDVFK